MREIILINSAGFNLAKVSLNKDLFFLGDNGTGKTTFIRAIHFLYTGDTTQLGIPANKKSFKEYYFPFSNSYIIYTFPTFFIFLYKRFGEIFKFFSKQRFDLSKIVKDYQALEIEEILPYLKEGTITRKVKGVREYQEILYQRGCIDFKIASITNTKSFFKIFNHIFNVDKAIIDTKSVKTALFNALDISPFAKVLNPQDYLSKLERFRSRYAFFSGMEHNRKRIIQLQELKEEILELEERLILLSKKINFRRSFEVRLKERLESQKEQLYHQVEKLLHAKENLLQREEKIKDKIEQKIAFERVNLKEIERLRERFETQKILQAQELITKEFFLKQEYEQLLTQLQGELRDKTLYLKERLETTLREYQTLKERLELNAQHHLFKLREELEVKKEELRLEREAKERELQKELERLRKELEKVEESFTQEKDNLIKKKEEFLNNLFAKRKELQQQILKLTQLENRYQEEIFKLQQNLEKREEKLLDQIQKVKESFLQQKEQLERELKEVQALLYPPKESFIAFLDKEVDGWREELYPLLDKGLLHRSVEELKPKIIATPVVWLKVEGVPSLPSLEELNSQQERLKKLLLLDEEALKEKIEELKEEFEKDKEQIEEKLHLLYQKREKIKTQKEELETLLSQEPHNPFIELEEQLNQKFRKQKEELNRKIKSLPFGKLYQEFKQKIQELELEFKQKEEEVKEKWKRKLQDLEEAYQRQKREIERELEQLKTSASNSNLLKRKEELAKRLEEIQRAKLFLQEYEQLKSKLEEAPTIRERLKRLQLCKEEFKKRFKEKLRRVEEEIKEIEIKVEEIEKKLRWIFRGVKSKIEVFSEEELESGEFLIQLDREFKELRVLHTEKMQQLERILKHLREIPTLEQFEIYLEMGEEEFLKEQPFLLENIENFLDLWSNRLEFLKQQEGKRFINSFGNEIEQRVELFINAENQFLKLVSKVNKNLKDVDFGVISQIKLLPNPSKENIAFYLKEIQERISSLNLVNQESLFFNLKEMKKILEELEELFLKLKNSIHEGALSVVDTIELEIEFNENGVKRRVLSLKNESSTGGSMLLKIALAISILRVYLNEEKSVFYLIIDEVARLSSSNQKKLKEFANQNGFKIIFVAPEPILANYKELLYYKFIKTPVGFEVIELNKEKVWEG